LLLAQKLAAVVQPRKQDKDNALIAACECGHLEVAKWTVECGARNYHAAITWAGKGGHVPILEWLVNDIGLNRMVNALTMASIHGNTSMVRWCLDHSKDVMVDVALWGAASAGHSDIVELLLPRSSVRPIMNSALDCAIREGHWKCATMILNSGMDVPKDVFEDQSVSFQFTVYVNANADAKRRIRERVGEESALARHCTNPAVSQMFRQVKLLCTEEWTRWC
jgi:hypothetical protein